MNRKVVSGVLAGIGMLALSTTAAHAGSGGGVPTALTSFFVCKTINGDAPARSVDVEALDASRTVGWNFRALGVRLGNATLACAFAKLFQPATPPQLPFDPNLVLDPQVLDNQVPPQPLTKYKDLKCYAISLPKSQMLDPITGLPLTGTPPSYTVDDNLFPTPSPSGLGGEDRDVTGSSVTYICAPAAFSPE